MKQWIRKRLSPLLVFLAVAVHAVPVQATQGHGGGEGLLSHLFAHLIFLSAMLFLMVRLRRKRELRQPGEAWILRAATLFVLWNVDTLFVHIYQGWFGPLSFTGDLFHLPSALSVRSLPELFYYFGRWDHLLSIPALFFLLIGIRKIRTSEEDRS